MSVARHPRDSVAQLRRSSAGWMPARIGRLSAGIGRRHPVTIRKASLMARMITAARNRSAVLCSRWTRDRVAVRNFVDPVPKPEPPQECDA